MQTKPTNPFQPILSQAAFMLGCVFCVIVDTSLYFVPPRNVIVMYILCCLGGMAISMGYLLPWSMLADCIDYGEFKIGRRNEGLYYSLFTFTQKGVLAFALMSSNVVLGLTGFVSGEDSIDEENVQPRSATIALRAMIGPVPAVMMAIAFFVMIPFPLSKKKVEQIQVELKRRLERKKERMMLKNQQKS